MRQPQIIGSPLGSMMLAAAVPQVARLIGMERMTGISDLIGALESLVTPDAYHTFYISKRRGGMREINAPSRRLKVVQRRILHALLGPHYQPTIVCHSYIRRRLRALDAPEETRWLPGRSIVSNALAHLGLSLEDWLSGRRDPKRRPRFLFSVDLKDAFPSVGTERILSIFEEITGDRWTATILTRLATHQNCLPQGAPTSGMLLNLACRSLDAELAARFGKPPFVVTRYADDIVLTSTRKNIPPKIQQQVIDSVERNGFRVNVGKTFSCRDDERVLRVTGINLVPREPWLSLPPRTIERLRVILYHSARMLRQLHDERARLPLMLPAMLEASFYRLGRRAIGCAAGVYGICRIVYGDALPPRIRSALPRIPTIVEEEPPEDPREESGETEFEALFNEGQDFSPSY